MNWPHELFGIPYLYKLVPLYIIDIQKIKNWQKANNLQQHDAGCKSSDIE